MAFVGGLNAYKKGFQEPGDDLKIIWAEKDALINEIKVLIPDLVYSKRVTCPACNQLHDQIISIHPSSLGAGTPDYYRNMLEDVKIYIKSKKNRKK